MSPGRIRMHSSPAVVDLRAYIDHPEWSLDMAEIPPAFWQQNEVEGRMLGLPAERSGRLLLLR